MSNSSNRKKKSQGARRSTRPTTRSTTRASSPFQAQTTTARATSGTTGSTGETTPGAQRAQRRQQRQAEEQRKKYIRIGAAVLGVALLGLAIWGVYRWWAGPDVSGDVVTYFDVDTANAVHPEEDIVILYEQVPPVGGPHNAIWQTCGFYSEYIYNWHGVHSMEHGAVWITYDPNLPQDQIGKLEDKADQGFVLISPYPGLDAPVVGSVWGKQMTFDGVDDERIDAFIRQYRVNPDNTPEQGATCNGGATFTTEEEPQQEPYQRVNPEASPVGGVTSTEATATAAAAD